MTNSEEDVKFLVKSEAQTHLRNKEKRKTPAKAANY
jgi:hypothetical protein